MGDDRWRLAEERGSSTGQSVVGISRQSSNIEHGSGSACAVSTSHRPGHVAGRILSASPVLPATIRLAARTNSPLWQCLDALPNSTRGPDSASSTTLFALPDDESPLSRTQTPVCLADGRLLLLPSAAVVR